MAQCATTVLAGAVPRLCVRGARGRFVGSGRYLVLCLSRFPLPAPCVPRFMWRAVPSGCPLPSLAGTPFHAVCAFRELGPVALLVVPACPLRVCALALPRRPLPPPPWVVWRVHLARSRHWALVGPFHVVRAPRRVLRRSLAASGVLGGGGQVPVPPYLAWGCAPSVAFVCRGVYWGGGAARAPCPPFVRPGGPVGRGVALPRSVPLPSLGRQQSGCHWRPSGHGGRGPHTALVRARPPSLGAICAVVLARWRGLACSPRFLWEPVAGAGGGPCSGSSLGQEEGGPSPPPRGGGGRRPRGLRAGGVGVGGGVALRPPCSPSGGRPAVPCPGPPLVVSALLPGVRVRPGSRGRPGGEGDEGRPVDRSPGGPSSPEPSLCPPRVGNGHGGGHGGRGPDTVLVRRRVPPPCLVRAPLQRAPLGSPVGRDPRGSRRLGALGRAVCRSSRIPRPPASRSPREEEGRLLGSGGAEGRSCGPQAGGGGAGGGVRGAAPPPPAPMPRRALACYPLSLARPPGVYLCRGGCRAAVGVRRGPVGPLAPSPDRRGGAAWQSRPRGPAVGRGVALFPRPPLPRAGLSWRPSQGSLVPPAVAARRWPVGGGREG